MIFKEKDGTAMVGYWFTGFGNQGSTEVDYVLWMFRHFFGHPWRPETGETSTVILDSWETETSHGGGNVACTGFSAVDFEAEISVVRTN